MTRPTFTVPAGFRAFGADLAKFIAITVGIAAWAVIIAAVFGL